MIISEVKRDKKHTVKITTQDGKSFWIDSDYFCETGIRSGDNITEERICEIIKESDYVRAKSKAIWLLDRADRSEKNLYKKLCESFSAESAARAIQRLKEVGLIDDWRLAERLAERLMEANVSKREAYAKMLAKGLPNDIIKQTLQETPVDEIEQIKAVIEKKYKARLSDPQEVRKVCAALMRKGFSYGNIRDVLKDYSEQLRYSQDEF